LKVPTEVLDGNNVESIFEFTLGGDATFAVAPADFFDYAGHSEEQFSNYETSFFDSVRSLLLIKSCRTSSEKKDRRYWIRWLGPNFGLEVAQ
jgi:hypothetical protein